MRWFVSLLLSLAIAGPAAAEAAERSYPYQVASKLHRGVVNVLASPVEIPRNAYKESHRSFRAGGNYNQNLVGSGAGAVLGFGYMLARIGVGVYDVLTFPIPTEPLMLPDVPYAGEPLETDCRGRVERAHRCGATR